MKKVDMVTKEYLRNKKVFVDTCNYFIYNGKQVIRPEDFRELDTADIGSPYNEIEQYRDLMGSAVLMRTNKAAYLVMGTGNGSDHEYVEPVRFGLYSTLHYLRQEQSAEEGGEKELIPMAALAHPI